MASTKSRMFRGPAAAELDVGGAALPVTCAAGAGAGSMPIESRPTMCCTAVARLTFLGMITKLFTPCRMRSEKRSPSESYMRLRISDACRSAQRWSIAWVREPGSMAKRHVIEARRVSIHEPGVRSV